jgi:hypothetical protein
MVGAFERINGNSEIALGLSFNTAATMINLAANLGLVSVRRSVTPRFL